jgi:hypothetical protein
MKEVIKQKYCLKKVKSEKKKLKTIDTTDVQEIDRHDILEIPMIKLQFFHLV